MYLCTKERTIKIVDPIDYVHLAAKGIQGYESTLMKTISIADWEEYL